MLQVNHLPAIIMNITWFTTLSRWMVELCSQCTEIISAPALAKSATRCSGSTIICSNNPSQHINHSHKRVSNQPPIENSVAWTDAYQMAIQHFISNRSECINHKGSNCDIGHKATIHNIYMNPITSCLINLLNLPIPESQATSLSYL